jgi:signal transduction histidine kinase
MMTNDKAGFSRNSVGRSGRKSQCFVRTVRFFADFGVESSGEGGTQIGNDLPKVANLLHFSLTQDGAYPSILLAVNSFLPANAVPSPQNTTGPWCRKRAQVSSLSKQASGLARVGDVSASVEGAPSLSELQEYAQLRERYLRTTNALASAAHDLKTPLAILNGYVELLQSEKLGDLNERQREVLRDMHSNGQRLQRYIQDFLSFSVLETGELKMKFESGNINACLSEVCRLWSPRFQEKGLALYFLANEKVFEFSFDAPKLERVISNLLENASKFTPSGGTVWLHAEPYMWERRSSSNRSLPQERRRRPLSQPNSVKISVSDTGPGVPPEYHLEIFDDFFRLPSSEKAEGMGLGLAIARRLVNGMGGKIWVESEPGAGCKFSFILPLMPPTSDPKEKANGR